MKKQYLGEFEELVMTVVAILEGKGYGKTIVNEINAKLDREVSLSAVHITLYRLEDKDMVKSRLGGATSKRGGRRKRIYEVTNAGLELLYIQQEQRQKLWKFMPDMRFGHLG